MGEFKLSVRRVTKVLIITTAALVLLHILFQAVIHFGGTSLWGLAHRFNLDREVSIPTWYAQLLLLGAALLLFVIGILKRRQRANYSAHWLGLGWIFLYLSLDEGAELHELLVLPTRHLLGIGPGWLYFAWVIPVALLLLVFAFAYWRFWRHLPRPTRRLFLGAAAVFITGAMVVELAGAYYSSHYGRDFYYFLIVAVEEGMEKFGMVIFIYALLDYLRALAPRLGLKLTP